MTKPFDPDHAALHGYTREDWDAVDSPELTSAEIRRMRPLREAMPDLHAAIGDARRRGPLRTKTPVSIRLDDDLLANLRASGPGWQSRVNEAVRRMIEHEKGR
jgi:uncharacterized protein (DUF4415 family)